MNANQCKRARKMQETKEAKAALPIPLASYSDPDLKITLSANLSPMLGPKLPD
jgi:hypothetical protein